MSGYSPTTRLSAGPPARRAPAQGHFWLGGLFARPAPRVPRGSRPLCSEDAARARRRLRRQRLTRHGRADVQLFATHVLPRQRRGAKVQFLASHVFPRRRSPAGRAGSAPAPAWRRRETPGEGDGQQGRRPGAAAIGALRRPTARQSLPHAYAKGPKLHFRPSPLPRPYARREKLHIGLAPPHTPKPHSRETGEQPAAPGCPVGGAQGRRALRAGTGARNLH